MKTLAGDKYLLGIVLSAVVAVGISNQSHAALIDNGGTTLDTSTNLIWLDVGGTVNLTFAQVAGQLGSGGTFAGYRFATGAEVQTLWGNAGVATVPYDNVPNAEAAAYSLLFSLLGTTWTSAYETYIWAYDSAGLRPFLALVPGENKQIARISHAESAAPGGAFSSLGSYLVRSATPTVPVPAAFPLLASALGALGLIGWRRSKRTID